MSKWPKYLAKFEIVATTLTSQFYRMGWCQKGPIVAVGTVFGNALLVSSTLQTDEFDALVTGVYGLNVVTFSTLELVTSIMFVQISPLSAANVTYYLVVWGWINLLFLIRSVRVRQWLPATFYGGILVGSLLEVIENLSGVSMFSVPSYIIIASVLSPVVEISQGITAMNKSNECTPAEEAPAMVCGLESFTDILNP